jgi:O-antigen/teichoic acid export membrane protein
MADAYWHTAAWLTVLSFPIIAVTGPLAQPVTLFLFGERYQSSGALLAVLSLGLFANAALGFNALTLQTYGRLRYVFTVNMACVALALTLAALLIPDHGAMGAAIAISVTLVAQNLLNQLGLARGVGITPFDRRYLRPYVMVGVACGGLWLVELTLGPPLLVGLALVGLLTVGLLRFNRQHLRLAETFPELTVLPLLSRLA